VSFGGHRAHDANNPSLLPELPPPLRPTLKPLIEQLGAFHAPEAEWSTSFLGYCEAQGVETTPEIVENCLRWCQENGYDPQQPISWLLYIDANNLYGYAMLQNLPTGDFQWLEEDPDDAAYLAWKHDHPRGEYFEYWLATYDGSRGAMLEVDLEYPDELHDMHSAFPLAPEKITITPDMIPEVLHDQCPSSTKLCTHLGPRHNYTVAVRNLRFYLKHGMRLTKIHRVLTFEESPWLAKWVRFCTAKRSQAQNDFEKDFWKLMANAVYGKTMEDVRNRMKMYFTRDDGKTKRKVAKPGFKQIMKLGEGLCACSADQGSVVLDKPIATGFAVLEESKLLMYTFHYEVMIPLVGWENLKVCMTDTDSLLYLMSNLPDLNEKLLQIRDEWLDTSSLPKHHPLYSKTTVNNKKIPGKFKDETLGEVICRFRGLRA